MLLFVRKCGEEDLEEAVLPEAIISVVLAASISSSKRRLWSFVVNVGSEHFSVARFFFSPR